MTRGKGGWIKLYESFLSSSVNYEMTLAQQAIFLKLCLLSKSCGQTPGFLADNDGRAIPIGYLAECVHAEKELLQETIAIAEDTNRIKSNGSGVLEIVNYKAYQPEYDRQKPYRQAKAGKGPAPKKLMEDD